MMKVSSLFAMLFLFLAAILPGGLFAAQNLLNNPDFNTRINGVPVGWNTNLVNDTAIKFLPGAGPDKANALKYSFKYRKVNNLGQGCITLVPDEKYRIGAYVRTKNFKSVRSGVAISNWGWMAEVQTGKIPVDTNGKWEKIEADVKCLHPHRYNYPYGSLMYAFNIYATECSGELEIASPYLIPLSDKAATLSRRARYVADDKDIIPVYPLLDRIPSENAVLKFYYPHLKEGRLRVGIGTYHSVSSVRAELKDSYATVKFPKLAEGPGSLRVDLWDKNNKHISYSLYPVTVVKIHKPTPRRFLNNFVAVLKDEPVKNGTSRFVLEDHSWLYLSVDSGQIFIDGKKLFQEKRGGRLESFCQLKPGMHTLDIRNAKGRFIMRTTPQIIAFPFHPVAKNDFERRRYTYDFYQKYMFPGFNSFNGASTWIPRDKVGTEAVKKLLKTGRELTVSGGQAASYWTDLFKFTNSIYLSRFDGRAIDEIGGTDPYGRLATLTDALTLLRNYEKKCHTWVKGCILHTPHIHNALITAQTNAGRGTGKFMGEFYIATHEKPSEQKLENDSIRDMIAKILKYRPDFCKYLMIISGGYITPGGYFTTYATETDPKYTHDMLFHMLANDPVFKNLYGIGLYSFTSSDEEFIRWYGQLLRHYGIEGNKSMLSEKYGYKFNPGHLLNGDFSRKLEAWQTQGKVEVRNIKGFGKKQGRRALRVPGKEIDDHCAILSTVKGKEAALIQKCKGFVPGKKYSITYTAGDKFDLDKRKKHNSKQLIELQMKGAKVHSVQNLNRYAAAAFTVRKVIFTAEKPEIEVKLLAPARQCSGKEIFVDYIAIRPYFEN